MRDAAGLDLLVTTGGASVGDYDLVQQALGREGLALDFWKIAMRPGKPLLFGRLGEVPVLGFPGNPVSTGVCAIVFLRLALQRMLGPAGAAAASGSCRLPMRSHANDQRQDYLRGAYVELDRRSACTHRRAAGQLDAGHLRRRRCAGGAPTVRSAREAGDMVTMIDLHEALDNLW